MKIGIRQVFIGVGMTILVTGLFLKTNRVDSDAHNRYRQGVGRLRELDANLGKDILESRYGLLTTYDVITGDLIEIEHQQDELSGMSAAIELNDKPELNRLLGEFTGVQEQKRVLIERFKSRNAIINNSIGYLPVATANLIDKLPQDPDGRKEIEALNHLLRDTLTYYLFSNSGLEPEIKGRILQLREARKTGPSDGMKTGRDIVLSHSETVLQLKPEVDDLVKEILSVPTAGKLEEVITLNDSYYDADMRRARIYRLLLYTFSVLMLGYIAFIFFKLRKATSAVHLVNESLERRVEERTEELSLSNVELKKSEANNRALLHAMPDSMWRTDKNGVFLDFIPAKDETAVVPADGWRGMTIFDILPDAVARQTIRLAELSLATGQTQIFDYQFNKGDKIHHYEGRVVVCGESEILTIVRDVTELRQAEAESDVISEIIQGVSNTSNLEELLRHIYVSISKVLYAENCFVALYDEKTEMLKLPFFVDKFDARPAAVGLGKSLTAHVFRTGRPALLTAENIGQLTDRGEVAMAGTRPAIWLGVPLRTPNGVIGVLVVQHYEDGGAYDQRDLDLLTSVGDQIAIAIERKRAEEALRASEARFQSAFDYAPIGIGLISPDGRWLQANHSLCEIVGYSKEELLGVDVMEITHPDDVEISGEAKRKLFEGKAKTTQLEKRYIHKLGRDVLAHTSLSLVRNAQHQPLYIIAQIQDITEQKGMEEKLHQAQKLESIGQLAAGIAHEINTPTQYVGDNIRFLQDSFDDLTSVLGKSAQMVGLCRRQKLTPEFTAEMEDAMEQADIEYLVNEVPKALKQAFDGVERIRKIVQSMKDFAHPGPVEMLATDLNKAIESTITVASNEWKYVAEMVTNYDEALPSIPCLVGEFNQVVLNMIVNAAHSITNVVGDGGNGKGTINITTTRNGDWAEIRISDTGAGIPEDIRKKIFDPFFTTKEVGKGTGQGLAISHNVIVDKHNGTIDVESETGKGTSFIIRLPIASGQMPALNSDRSNSRA